MRYRNGALRNERDDTLRLRPASLQQKLTWPEYLPLIVLGLLILGILTVGMFHN